jgi:hypothetical protein
MNRFIPACLIIVPLSFRAGAGEPEFLLREIFSGPRLTPDIWDARPEQPRLNYLGGGYLALSRPEHSLYSREAFGRRAGRCLAVVYCGNMHRGGADNWNNPSVQFARAIRPANRMQAGAGFVIGQRQGFTARLINTVVPFGEGVVGPALDNDNVDTLFLTVLRERGAFYLMCGEPASTPPEAKLCFVSHTGDRGPYHVAIAGGRANSRIASAEVVDLPGPWQEKSGLATVVDTFWDTALSKPDKGYGPWEKSGYWSAGFGLCHLDGWLLTEARSPDQYVEVRVTPSGNTKSVALLLRAADKHNCIQFELKPSGVRLVQRIRGEEKEIAPAAWGRAHLTLGQSHRLRNLFTITWTFSLDIVPLNR